MPAAAAAALLTATLTLSPGCSHPSDPPAPERWREIETEIRNRFPAVEHVDTAGVRRLLRNRRVVIVDVRSPREFAVSHLVQARSAPLNARLIDRLADVPKERHIVLYCSVGYRSAEAAHRLVAAGYPNVHNYLGSIFAWANAGLPLVNQGGSTSKVHPFDSDWGQLLRPSLAHQIEEESGLLDRSPQPTGR